MLLGGLHELLHDGVQALFFQPRQAGVFQPRDNQRGKGRTQHRKPYGDFELSSLRGKIKRVQARLADLDKLQAAAQQPDNTTKFDGGEIVRNAEENRLQILFDEIPDADTRDALKSNGFRWSPRNKAWQRQLTQNAEYAARRVLGL